jgi:hypothetical protein
MVVLTDLLLVLNVRKHSLMSSVGVGDVKTSKTLIMYIVSGNSFTVSQFRRDCVVFYVLIVKIRKKIVIETERKREQIRELSRQMYTSCQ